MWSVIHWFLSSVELFTVQYLNINEKMNGSNRFLKLFLMNSNSNAEICVLVHIELAGLNSMLAGVQQLWQTPHPLSQTG